MSQSSTLSPHNLDTRLDTIGQSCPTKFRHKIPIHYDDHIITPDACTCHSSQRTVPIRQPIVTSKTRAAPNHCRFTKSDITLATSVAVLVTSCQRKVTVFFANASTSLFHCCFSNSSAEGFFGGGSCAIADFFKSSSWANLR